MKPPAWIRWFPSNWRGSGHVADMSLAERGLYHELLMLEASAGPFLWRPANLARQLRCDKAELEALWPTVKERFTEADGAWSNPRVHEEVERCAAMHSAQSERGKKGAAARWPDGASNSASTDPAMAQGMANKNKNKSKNKKKTQKNKEGAGARSSEPKWLASALENRPPGVPAPAWKKFLFHQKERKKPTPTALQSHYEKLAEVAEAHGGEAASALVDGCVSSNAQGIPPFAFKRALDGGEVNGRPQGTGQLFDRHAGGKRWLEKSDDRTS